MNDDGRPPGLWLRLSATYWTDDRVLAVTTEAELMYVRSLAYCKAQGSGGVIHDTALGYLGLKMGDPADCARQLVSAGLWERTATGWRIPPDRWARWQSSMRNHAAQRAAAYARWHRAGMHTDTPHDACPLCAASDKVPADDDF